MIRSLRNFSVVLLLTACSSSPPPVLPPAEDTAARWDQRGQEAFRAGSAQEALVAYRESLRLYTSVENAEGAATELLNIATVHYQIGERDRAAEALSELLTTRATATPVRLKADAAYRLALLDFDAGNNDRAAESLDRAQALCESKCDIDGRLNNLRARLLLARGKLAEAETTARRGLDINRRRSDVAEEANSLRILAEIAARDRRNAQSLSFYEQALTLDKAAAEPRKIMLDLLGAGRSLAAQGKSNDATLYAERALRVAESIGDEQAQLQAKALLKTSIR